MPLHKKIIHHFHKHKARVIAHVNKHHKKYIFGTGVAFGLGALKVIAIVAVFLGIQMTIGTSNAADQKVEIYKQLAVFNIIDDFVHQRIGEISAEKNPATAEIDKQFPIIDAAYHNAKNLNEKYQAAKTLVEFVVKGRDIVRNLGYTTPEEDAIFDQMIFNFYQIK